MGQSYWGMDRLSFIKFILLGSLKWLILLCQILASNAARNRRNNARAAGFDDIVADKGGQRAHA